MIFIGNKRSGHQGIYVARGSPLGNPFIIGKDGTREQVIDKYRVWLYNQLESDTPQRRAIDALVERYKRGESFTLICYCYPLACHAEIIRDVIVERSICS